MSIKIDNGVWGGKSDPKNKSALGNHIRVRWKSTNLLVMKNNQNSEYFKSAHISIKHLTRASWMIWPMNLVALCLSRLVFSEQKHLFLYVPVYYNHKNVHLSFWNQIIIETHDHSQFHESVLIIKVTYNVEKNCAEIWFLHSFKDLQIWMFGLRVKKQGWIMLIVCSFTYGKPTTTYTPLSFSLNSRDVGCVGHRWPTWCTALLITSGSSWEVCVHVAKLQREECFGTYVKEGWFRE